MGILIAILWLGGPLLMTIGMNKVSYLYDTSSDKIGVSLKKRTWGLTMKDMKLVQKHSMNTDIQRDIRTAILLRRLGIYSIILALFILVIISPLLHVLLRE